MTRYLLALLLCASAFGAAAPKPPAADDVRNIHAPAADFLAVAYAGNENSGTTLTNVGKRSSSNGTLNAATWSSDSEGVYPGVRAQGPTASGNQVYPRGTMLFYAQSGGASILNVLTINAQATGSVGNSISIQIDAGDFIRFNYSDSSLTQTQLTVSSASVPQTFVPIVIQWGERGLWLYTPYGTASDTSVTGLVIIRNGNELNLAASPTYAATTQRFHSFAWWDWQLSEREVRELLADPFLPFRPRLVEGGDYQVMHTANPIVGRPTTTSLTWQVGVPRATEGTFTKELDWKIAYTRADATLATNITSNGVLRFSDVTTTGWKEVRSTHAGLPSTITATGLSAGTLYVWQARYREDDGTVQAFPGGIGYATTQRSSGAFSFAVTTDCHEGNLYLSDVLELARGLDVTSNGLADQQMRRGFITARDQLEYCYEHGCDFTMDVGDSSIGQRGDSWSAVLNDTFKAGAYFQTLGNHEKMAGAYLEVLAGEDNRTIDGIANARMLFCNPTGTTYPQGGESEGCPADPYGGTDGAAYCPGVSWVPGEASSPCVSPDRLEDEAWNTRADARVQSEMYLEFNTSGSTWVEKLGILEPACSNGLGNYYGFTWSDASFWTLDPYLYTAVGSDETDLQRASIDDWQYGAVQQGWLELAMAADTSPWKFVFQHQLPGGLIGGANGTTADYYGRGSGASNPTTAAEKWYWGILREHGAIGLKGHDHGFALVEQGGAQQYTVGNFASSSRFIGDSWRWNYPMDYGDPSMFGANVPQVETMRPQWGWGYVTVTDASTATYTYRQTVVDQVDLDDQSTPDTWTSSYRISGEIGDVLTVGSGGNVTLTETPNDVLVVCNADDGDFLQYGWNAAIADTNWGGANDYSPTLQDWGTNGSGNACIDLDDFTEPHKDAVIATAYAQGTRVRVHYAPRDLYTATLHRAVSNPTYVPLDGTVRGSTGLHYRGD